MSFKVIIAGCRDYNDYSTLSQYVTKMLSNKILEEEIEIVSGHARGADTLGERYAVKNNMLLRLFPADWNRYGKSAGPIRNAQMAEYADVLIAFWDGKSRGTANMISTMRQLGKPVRVFKF